MDIESIHRPNQIDSPDTVQVVNTNNACVEAILDFVFADPRVDRPSYYDANVRLWEDDSTATVRLYKS